MATKAMRNTTKIEPSWSTSTHACIGAPTTAAMPQIMESGDDVPTTAFLALGGRGGGVRDQLNQLLYHSKIWLVFFPSQNLLGGGGFWTPN